MAPDSGLPGYMGMSSKISTVNRPLPSDRKGWSSVYFLAAAARWARDRPAPGLLPGSGRSAAGGAAAAAPAGAQHH